MAFQHLLDSVDEYLFRFKYLSEKDYSEHKDSNKEVTQQHDIHKLSFKSSTQRYKKSPKSRITVSLLPTFSAFSRSMTYRWFFGFISLYCRRNRNIQYLLCWSTEYQHCTGICLDRPKKSSKPHLECFMHTLYTKNTCNILRRLYDVLTGTALADIVVNWIWYPINY